MLRVNVRQYEAITPVAKQSPETRETQNGSNALPRPFSNRDAVSSSGTVSAIAKTFSFDVTTHCPAGNGMSARVSFHVRSGNLWLQCFASWTRYFPAWGVSILAVLINFFSIAE